MREQVEQFLRSLQVDKGYSANTIAAYRNDLDQLAAFIERTTAGSVGSWAELDPQVIQEYGRYLKAQSYAASTVARKVASVKSFYSFMVDSGLLTVNPAAVLATPKLEKHSPRILSTEEVCILLAQANEGATSKALRDRALLELFYATGMRVSEVIAMQLDDLDVAGARVFCARRDGKMRELPLNSRAAEALSAYLENGRESLLPDHAETTVFVNQRGHPLTRQGLWLIIKSCAEAAGLGPGVTPHTLRHSCAVHRLAQGANVQRVGELLGHANVSSTQVYKDMFNPSFEEFDANLSEQSDTNARI